MSEHVEVEKEYNVGDTIEISFALESESLPPFAKIVVTFSHQELPNQQILLSEDLSEKVQQVQLTHEVTNLDTSGVYTLDSVILAQFEGTFLESKEEIDEIIPRGTRIRINPYRKPESKITDFTIDKK